MDLTKMSRDELIKHTFNITSELGMVTVQTVRADGLDELVLRLAAAEAELTRWQDWAIAARKAEHEAARTTKE